MHTNWHGAGKQVELKPRPVDVYSIDLVEFDSPHVVVDIHCGSGTYIRSIARDLGEQLGCGALMSKLVRMAVGPYRLEDAIAPDEVTCDTLADLLISPTTVVDHMPQYRCTAEQLEEIINGRKFELSRDVYCDRAAGVDQREPPDGETHEKEALVLLTPAGELAALANYSVNDELVAPKQVFCDVPG